MRDFLALLIALPFLLLSCSPGQETATADREEVIASYIDDRQKVDYLKLARLNLSLAETGQLANKAFHYTQAGSDGILVPWNLNVETGECLSEMYWSTGPIPSWDPDAGASLKKYNDTFWYYIMRVNNQ